MYHVESTGSPGYRAIGPDLSVTKHGREITDTRELLNNIEYDQGGPHGHKYILQKILNTDRWKFKKEHFKSNERKPKKFIFKAELFA